MQVRDAAFWLLYLATPLGVLFFAHRGYLSLRRASIPSVLLMAYGAFAYVGLPLLYHHLDVLRLGLDDDELLFAMLAYASLAWIGLSVGCWLYGRLAGPPPQTLSPTVKGLGGGQLAYCLLMLFLAIGVYAAYLSRVPGMALTAALRHDYQSQVLLRSQMTYGSFAGLFAWGQLLYKDVAFLLCFVFFSQALVRARLWAWGVWLASFLFCVTVSLVAAQKGPLVHLAVGLFFVFVLTRHSGRLSLRALAVLVAVVAASLVVVLSVLLTGSSELIPNALSVLSRMFTGSLTPAYFYLKMFPASHPFLHGASLSNLGGLLPFDTFPLTRAVHAFMAPQYVAQGIYGSAPTAFWGEAYANFGPAGPLLLAIPLGAYACLLQGVVARLPASPVSIGFLAWLILHVQFLSITSFSNYLTDQHLAVVALAALSCLWLGDRAFPGQFRCYVGQALGFELRVPGTDGHD